MHLNKSLPQFSKVCLGMQQMEGVGWDGKGVKNDQVSLISFMYCDLANALNSTCILRAKIVADFCSYF